MAEPAHPPYLYSFGEPHRLDPDPLHARLRAEEPVARVRLPYGREGWLVTRFEAVRTVISDPRFSRAAALGADIPRSTPPPPRKDVLASFDPPEHTRLRKLVARAFTDRRIEQRRPRAQEITEELLAELAAHGPPADLIDMFTTRLPIAMICEILGVPYEDHVQFRDWAIPQFSTTAYSADQMRQARDQLCTYFARLIAQRRKQATDDVLGALVMAHDEGDYLSGDELVSLAVTLLSSGHESVANLIANSVYLLLTNPDQLAWLRQDLSRVPQAAEELLRFIPLAAGAPNAEGNARVATVEVELDGVRIASGEPVLPSIVSANRDERVFTDPDRLDLSRAPNPHIAFGHGPHHCLGAQLARLELQVSLTALLLRFPTLRLAVPPDEVPWKAGLLTRGPQELPVAW